MYIFYIDFGLGLFSKILITIRERSYNFIQERERKKREILREHIQAVITQFLLVYNDRD